MAGISIIAILSTEYLPAAIIAGMVYFIIMALLRFEPENIYSLRRLYFKGAVSDLKFIKNGELYGISGKFIFTVIEMENKELYTDSAKGIQIMAIARMLDMVTCNATVLTKAEKMGDAFYYRTFILLKSNKGNFNHAVDIIRENIPTFVSGNSVKAWPVDDENLISSLFYNGVSTHSNYFKKDKLYGSYFDVLDTEYSSDFLYQSIIERLGFIIELNMELVPISGKDVFLKRLMASRKAELSYTKAGHYASLLKKQISSLEYISKQDKLYNVFIRFSVLSEHPAELREYSDKFRKTMESAGFKMRGFHFFNKASFNPLETAIQGKKYLMNPEAISSIFPCGFTTIPDSSGEPLGVNLITGKKAYLNLFHGPSYNVAITGETGSGKSYFTGMFLDKFRNSSSVFIIDPLKEYSGDQIIELGTGEYPDFTIGYGLIGNIIPDLLGNISGISPGKVRQLMDVIEKRHNNIIFSELISEIMKYDTVNSVNRKFLFGKLFRVPVEVSGNRTVFRFDYGDTRFRDLFFRLALSLTISLAENRNGNKIVVIDESHLFIKDAGNAEMTDMLARNGRHNKISLITVTQNINDYYFNSYAESILRNSVNYFIFRQHEKIKDKLFLGYSIDPVSLAGGSNFNYSECFYSTGTLIRKLKIAEDR